MYLCIMQPLLWRNAVTHHIPLSVRFLTTSQTRAMLVRFGEYVSSLISDDVPILITLTLQLYFKHLPS